MRQFLELLTTFLAFGIGMFFFRKLDRFYRLVFFQVGIFLLTDLTGLMLGENNWVFNLQVPVETALLFSAALPYFESNRSKSVLLILFGLFLVIYFIDIFYLTGITSFAYHAAIAEGFLITLIYTTLLYFRFMNGQLRSSNNALIIASIGMIIYFACTIPYLCVMFYFQSIDPVLNYKIFPWIIISLASLRYLFIAIAFFINGQNRLSSQTN